MQTTLVPSAFRIYIVVYFLIMATLPVRAMPMFARKLNVPCSTCHTTIPRLNETGYRFRAAGFRMPEEISKTEEKKFDVADYFSGRIQAEYDASRSKTGTAPSKVINQLSFTELTLYPMTGAWGKYLSSLVELSFLPDEPAEVENGYMRGDFGHPNKFFEARVGIFHPFEGYGASDRPASINRPLFQRVAANFNQGTFFTPWGFDEAGAEVGLDYHRLSARASIFNGLVLAQENGALTAFPAQGGVLNKPTSLTAHNTPDFQFFANYVLNSDGGGLSFYYYHGNIELPTNTSDLTQPFWRNNFDRYAVYGSYPVMKHLNLFAAFQEGRDDIFGGTTFHSRGTFVEANFPIGEYVSPGVRYDWFDPATDKAQDRQWDIVPYVNVPLQNGLQFIAEYRHRDFQQGVGNPSRNDNAFQIRFIFIK